MVKTPFDGIPSGLYGILTKWLLGFTYRVLTMAQWHGQEGQAQQDLTSRTFGSDPEVGPLAICGDAEEGYP